MQKTTPKKKLRQQKGYDDPKMIKSKSLTISCSIASNSLGIEVIYPCRDSPIIWNNTATSWRKVQLQSS